MATLHWIGKEKVVNHHLEVPFKTLKHKYTYKDGKKLEDGTRSENKIIHGDNLEALKSLLPEYEGKIKCIYIDPPYNTGNEGWVYNDNVNHPKIKKWLGDIVGKEGEDLSRHDKWLCMIYPRLKLLYKLLADDGVIFVSIDDKEQSRLQLLCDEIFGGPNLLSVQHIQVRYENKSLNEDSDWQPVMEYVLVYAKNSKSFKANKPSEPYDLSKFEWDIEELSEGEEIFTGNKKVTIFKEGEWEIRKRQQGGIGGLKETWASGSLVRQSGTAGEFLDKYLVQRREIDGLNVLYKIDNMGEDGLGYRYVSGPKKQNATRGKYYSGVPLKRLEDVKNGVSMKDRPIPNYHNFAGDFGNIRHEGFLAFNNGKKPIKLIKQFINYHKDTDVIVLDSFAGSGSTAHAVIDLNKEDGGSRSFILVEMEDYAEDVTAERIKRVIKGYGQANGTGGDFEYLELGDPLFDGDGYICEQQPIEDIRKYVYYSETRTNSGYSDNPKNQFYLGKRSGAAYYFFYKKDVITTLDVKFVSGINIKADQYVVYADKCSLSEEYLRKHNIIFKKIPRDITKI